MQEGHPSGYSSPSTAPPPSAGHTATSSEDILSLLEQTFTSGTIKYRSHALEGTSSEASYFNLGAFSQSVRKGITRHTFQFQSILCRLNAWLHMLFPLGTWSSICISHNETLKLHRDTSNEPGTSNYTITLGEFSGGGLLLECAAGDRTLHVDSLGKDLQFRLVRTKETPFEFDGRLWHATEPFIGNRWVVTAYTSQHLPNFSDADISSLRMWGFPLPGGPQATALPSGEPTSIPVPKLPKHFCLVCCHPPCQALGAGLSSAGVPHVRITSLKVEATRRSVFRCCAEGVFPSVFIVFSQTWTPQDLQWMLQLCKVAHAAGSAVHLDISEWSTCWENQFFLHCVATGLHNVVQVPPCAFQRFG